MRVAHWIAGLVMLSPVVGGGWAQQREVVPLAVGEGSGTVAGALSALAARAGVVFAGEVTRMERKPGVLEITFRVLQAVQGTVGAEYTVREWLGLSAGGQTRYAVGQRALYFLHATNKAGFSSPVNGMEGIVALKPQEGSTMVVDLSRVAAGVQRAQGAALASAAENTIALSQAVAILVASRVPVVSRPPAVQPGLPVPVPVQAPGEEFPRPVLPEEPVALLKADR